MRRLISSKQHSVCWTQSAYETHVRVNKLKISKYSVLRALEGRRRKNSGELFIFINLALSWGEAFSPATVKISWVQDSLLETEQTCQTTRFHVHTFASQELSQPISAGQIGKTTDQWRKLHQIWAVMSLFGCLCSLKQAGLWLAVSVPIIHHSDDIIILCHYHYSCAVDSVFFYIWNDFHYTVIVTVPRDHIWALQPSDRRPTTLTFSSEKKTSSISLTYYIWKWSD